MAKEYIPAERNDERNAANKSAENPNEKIAAEQQKQSEARAKEQKTYCDEMNKNIKTVVDGAGSQKDKDPQLMNYTVEALRNAANQIEAATKQPL